MSSSNLVRQLTEGLPSELLATLRKLSDIAAAQSHILYLVGGAVRDILLKRPSLDIDLTVEGDALALVPHFAVILGLPKVTHPSFGTASFGWGPYTIDVATARRERYRRPGALPQVEPSTLMEDLHRRDFTINAMAIHLSPSRFGEQIDPFGGRGDLRKRLIRILHPESFKDDATRILRALRYEQRLGFRLEKGTEAYLRRDRAMLNTVGRDRLRQGWELILKEEKPETILNRAAALGITLHASLSGDSWLAKVFPKARQAWGTPPPPPSLYLAIFCYALSPEGAEAVIQSLRLTKGTAKVIMDTLQIKEDIPSLAQADLLPSRIYRLLQQRSNQAILAASLATDSSLIQNRLQTYLNTLRYIKPHLNGQALQRMGVLPGTDLGKLLKALHQARLDQEVTTIEEEQAWVYRWLEAKAEKKGED
ncbi:MAG: CCA tRNA nucleotidyltransferase [Chloroflexi bacterium]|nr:CCA tRNA nucleotidyltransferase [Chloroflexota bacterium]